MLALCVESSHARGMGHLFRALNLAAGMRQRGLAYCFLVNRHGPSEELLCRGKHAYEVVPMDDQDGEWERGVVRRLGIRLWLDDRLNTSLRHARQVKDLGLSLVTFDDRGDGAALADLNVAALVFENTVALQGRRVLQGADYLVLNSEIARHRRARTRADSLLVTMGGSDTYGVSVQVVQRLVALRRHAKVVAGPGFAHMQALEQASSNDIEIVRGLPSLVAEFEHHDLVITGGGVTPFEAAASGLPSIVIASEDFEIPVGRALAAMCVAAFAGHHATADWTLLEAELPIAAMSQAGLERFDLQGRERVLDAIEECLAQS